MRWILCIVLLLLAAGCGAEAPEDLTVAATLIEGPLYETNAMVLQDAAHGPMLCLGGMPAIDPPQCGTVPITNWDWNAVAGEETNGATTWGRFYVIGSYDGDVFELVQAGPVGELAEVELFGDSKDRPACKKPPGGWVVPKHGRTDDEQAGNAAGWASGQRQYVAAWVTYLKDPGPAFDAGDEGPFPVILSIVVSRDAALFEAKVRERWDGPLCVVERDLPTYGEAAKLRADAEASLEGLGLQMLGSYEGELGEVAAIEVVADPGGEGQAALDERFGEGLVRLVPQLVPVP